jgi:hypothetical protein
MFELRVGQVQNSWFQSYKTIEFKVSRFLTTHYWTRLPLVITHLDPGSQLLTHVGPRNVAKPLGDKISHSWVPWSGSQNNRSLYWQSQKM